MPVHSNPSCTNTGFKILLLSVFKHAQSRIWAVEETAFFFCFGKLFDLCNFLDDYSHAGFPHIGLRVSDTTAAALWLVGSGLAGMQAVS